MEEYGDGSDGIYIVFLLEHLETMISALATLHHPQNTWEYTQMPLNNGYSHFKHLHFEKFCEVFNIIV